MPENLRFRAGPIAARHIQKNGLNVEDICCVAGAAGGPKWLTLAGIDRWLFPHWLAKRNQPLPLIGSSAGAWRMAAACAANDRTLDELTSSYIEQQYDGVPSPEEISETAADILDDFLEADHTSAALLEHPIFRLNIITAKCSGGMASDNTNRQKISGLAAATANLLGRPLLRRWFQRVVFHDPRQLNAHPPIEFQDAFGNTQISLTQNNIKSALLASGSIPLVMKGVHNPDGAPPGLYRDGGVIDYHMDLAIKPTEGIILLPHFSPKVVPGWLDKMLPWRKPQHLQNTLLIHPSEEFIQSLPNQKIPDRNDFKLYFGRDDERIKDWYSVVEKSKALGEELEYVLNQQKIDDVLELL